MTVSFFAHPDPIVVWSYTSYLCVALLSGIACGAVGIGGVFLAPTLLLVGVRPNIAVATVLSSFLPQSIAQVFIARARVHRVGAVCLSLGALPGAAGAALLLPVIPGSVITVIVGVVALFSGVNTLRQIITLWRGRKRKGEEGGVVVDCQEKVMSSVDIEMKKNEEEDGKKDDNERKEKEKKEKEKEKEKREKKDKEEFLMLFQTKRDRWTLVGVGVFGGFMSVMTSSGTNF